ncbi:MAG TPA: flagellar basal body P-ring protein FlgI [Polyangiaceae bacterium]|nr:flagellar basal body P-ring protein FlgI [Polyangiaceae bacterium]
MKLLAGLLLALIALVPGTARADKVHDLVDIVGARENQLIGYGVVTGLQGTGDDISSPFALQSLRALLRRLGVQVDSRQIRLKNVAAVIVTANIPAFARNGSKLDIVVSSMGNSRSLRGGVLIQTPLRGADRRTYAVGQGPLVLGGFSASGGSGSSVQENITTTARIPNGALIEREIKTVFAADGKVTLALRAPNFDTATRIAEGLNKAMGEGTARALDGGSIEVKAPSELKNKPVELISKLGDVEVDPGSVARVVLNERTGTIVAGGDVRLSPVAIAQGGITISVKESKEVSQPGILSRGTTAEVKRTDIETTEQKPPALTYVNGAASLAEVAQALSTFGVTPRELGSILQALKAAGALRAEVVVQ